MDPSLAIVPVGTNPTLLWGMTNVERTRRIAASQGFAAGDTGGPAILANMAFAFDPVWTTHLKTRPGTVVTRGGVPVLAHVRNDDERDTVMRAMREESGLQLTAGLTVIAAEADEGILNEALRKIGRASCRERVLYTV